MFRDSITREGRRGKTFTATTQRALLLLASTCLFLGSAYALLRRFGRDIVQGSGGDLQMRSGHLSTRLSSARRGSPYIVCWILRSSSKEDFLKSEAIRFGWGRHCDHLEYIDRGTPGIMADWEEGHKHIAGKSFRAWQFIDEKYVRDAERTGNRTVDFAVKADTDTYIIGDHLREYLNRFDPDLPHYIGKQLMHAEGYPMVAGTAIILSRAALRIFAKASYKSAGKCTWEGWFPGAEDVALALCLREHGVYPHDTKDANGAERFIPATGGCGGRWLSSRDLSGAWPGRDGRGVELRRI